MTQTKIDPATAEAPELIRALAEKPCTAASDEDCSTDNVRCLGTGLANPWASEVCVRSVTVKGEEVFMLCKGTDDCQCNGSGRVPKAPGLEELWQHGGLVSVKKYDTDKYGAIHESDPHMLAGVGETPLLAALRAVAAKV